MVLLVLIYRLTATDCGLEAWITQFGPGTFEKDDNYSNTTLLLKFSH